MAPVTTDMPRVNRPLARALAAFVAVAATALAILPAGTAAGVPSQVLDDRGRVTFTISSFNVLGSFHTKPRSRLAWMGSGPERIARAVRLLDQHSVDVVGFQEFQMDQFEEFYRLAGDRYGVYPGGLNRRAVQNSIAWKTDAWQFVDGRAVPIPYFDGIEWAMPVVLLQNKLTGQMAYFANFHNPATNRRHRGNDKWRAEAMRREIALANTIHAESGLPLFITGDMNERDDYFCPMAEQAPMKAANGGKSKDGVCTMPPAPGVDWIFGAKRRGKFVSFLRDDSRLVDRTSDHPMIVADVRLKPAVLDGTPPVVPPLEVPAWPLFPTVLGFPATPTVPVPPTPEPCAPDPETGTIPPTDPATGAPCPTPTPTPAPAT
jgi:hypothetical protein